MLAQALTLWNDRAPPRLKTLANTDAARFLSFIVLAIFAYHVFKETLMLPAKKEYLLPLLWAGTGIIAFLGRNMRRADLDTCSRAIVTTVLALFSLYVFFARPTILFDGLPLADKFTLGPGRYIALACLIAAFWRPSLAVVGLSYIIWYKAGLSRILGTRISYTDYTPLLEMTLFITLTQMLLPLAARTKYWAPLVKQAKDKTILTAREKIALFAIATHFANYFFSGWKKLWLGDHIWSWAFENRTQNLILASWDVNQLPLTFFHGLPALAFHAMSLVVVYSNVIILVAQLLALIGLVRIRWALALTVFYDLTHITIYIVSGIFFYKWIVLNFAIVAGLTTIHYKKVPAWLGASLVAMVLFAPQVFFVASLGWWDTPSFNVEKIYAVDKQGHEIPVPTNFWGSFSVHMAQGRLVPGKREGFLPTGTYGNIFGAENVKRAQACDYQLKKSGGDADVKELFQRDPSMEKFIRRYHAWAMQKTGGGRPWHYDLYPHHIFSSFWDFNEFSRLNLRDITAYRYKVSAACLSVKDGQLQEKVLRVGNYDIPVGQHQ